MVFFPEFRKFQVVKSCPWMPGLYCNNARIVDHRKMTHNITSMNENISMDITIEMSVNASGLKITTS
jgi:hypothetical protein